MAAVTLDPRAAQLIEHLHRGGTVDYTWAVRGAEKTSFWRTIGEAQPTILNSQHNMYFGVHPCIAIPPTNSKGEPKPPRAVRSQLAYIAAINCLFAEFDAKDFDGGKDRVKAHIKALDPAPSVVVDSGGGYHCYWLLIEPFMLDSGEARARADRAQKGWVKHVRSDDDAKDFARVLRIPGTRNFKYDPPRPVEVLEADYSRLYSLDEFEVLLPPEPAAKAKPTRQTASTPAAPVADDDRTDLDRIAEITSLLQLESLGAEEQQV